MHHDKKQELNLIETCSHLSSDDIFATKRTSSLAPFERSIESLAAFLAAVVIEEMPLDFKILFWLILSLWTNVKNYRGS